MKDKEIYLGTINGNKDVIYMSVETWEIIDKALKTLEIIKEKNVNIQYIKDKDCSFEMYNKMVLLKEWRLTQEEYDLLKEVLSND